MKKNRVRFVAFWCVAVALAGFYLLMLVWGKSPEVGIEYRMYYITHELSDWPGYGNLSYSYGTKEYCTSLKDKKGKYQTFSDGVVCQRKGQGFEENQLEGSRSTGNEAFIYYIPEESKTNAQYEIEINEFTGDGEVTVYAGDTAIGTFAKEGTYVFEAGNLTKDELLTIKYVTNNCSFRLWTTCVK